MCRVHLSGEVWKVTHTYRHEHIHMYTHATHTGILRCTHTHTGTDTHRKALSDTHTVHCVAYPCVSVKGTRLLR